MPRDAIAVQLEHTNESCVITTLWNSPDNLAEAPVSNYTITVLNGIVVSHDSVQSILVNATNEPEGPFSTLVAVPSCGRYLVNLQANNVCGVESPEVTIALSDSEGGCLIIQDSFCVAEGIVTTQTDTTPSSDHYATTTNSNAADMPQCK